MMEQFEEERGRGKGTMIFWEEPKKRTRIGKTEWEAIKARHRNRCCVCSKTEKSAGVFEKAHIKVHSKGGTQYFSLCTTCHPKYDKGLMTVTELRKLGLTKQAYAHLKPKTKRNK